MELHSSSIVSDSTKNTKSISRSRDVSVESYRSQGGNSQDYSHNLTTGMPVLGLLDEGMASDSPGVMSPLTKTSNSRGSSPASKKKPYSDGNPNSMKRRSPLVSRKVVTIADVSQTTPPTGRVRHYPQDSQTTSTEDCDGDGLPGNSNGSGDGVDVNHFIISTNDETDGSSPIDQKTKELMEHFQSKSLKILGLIKEEQRNRDANVDEYLKVAANADKQQLGRIKAVFEKKNQKSAVSIQQLQKKQEYYIRKIKEIESHRGLVSHRQPKEVFKGMSHGLKSVGGNIREGISGLSGRAALIQKPREFAHLLKNKFGSADNIKELEDEKDDDKTHHGSATLPPNSGLHPTSSSVALSSQAPPTVSGGISGSGESGGGGGGSSGGGKVCSEEGGSECSSITSESIPGLATLPMPAFSSPRNRDGNLSFDTTTVFEVIHDLQEENNRLKEEIEIIKQTLTSEVNHLRDGLLEERFRCERLEEQVNDLTELNQNETENLKTAITDMEEKVQYQSEERIRDLSEVVENCQTRISRMEHQQLQQQQQFLTLEGLENSNARVLFVKLINVLLTILQVFLLVVATVVGILTPLLQTRTRLVATVTVILFSVFVYTQFSEIRDLMNIIITHIKALFPSLRSS